MDNKIQQGTAFLSAKHHWRKRWRVAVSLLAAVVILVQQYALIIPAATLERETYCGLAEHVHTQDCYTLDPDTGEEVLSCGLTEHEHNDNCYNEALFVDNSSSDVTSVTNSSELEIQEPAVEEPDNIESEAVSDPEPEEVEEPEEVVEETTEDENVEETEEPSDNEESEVDFDDLLAIETADSAARATTIDPNELKPYLNTNSGMSYVSSSSDDDSTFSTTGLSGFYYNGIQASTIYISSNHWIGFGTNSEQLKVMRRDGRSTSIYRQTGKLSNNINFLKIRFEGYTVYNNQIEANRLIFELFLIEGGDMYLNMVQTPTNGNTGTSQVVTSQETISLSLSAGKLVHLSRLDESGYFWVDSSNQPDMKATPVNGTCGTNLTWALTEEGKLTISGTGAMTNYSSTNAPWYSQRKYITSIEVEEGVTSIGNYAFNYCVRAEEIKIPSTVTSIGSYAFNNCASVEQIVIPSNVTSIPDYAFNGCSSLEAITIPSKVTSIGNYAFAFCRSLSSVTIPSSVTNLGTYVFSNCSSLESATISSGGITTLPSYTFNGCSSLTGFTIPASVTTLNSYAFSGCTGLTSITIPSTVTNLGTYVFNGCTSLETATIRSGLKSIPDYTFNGCTKLSSVTIPASVTTLNNYAFSGCTGLTSITIPASVTSMGTYVFNGCTSLRTATINTKITTLPSYTFNGCTSLKEVNNISNVTNIGSYAFNNCSALEEITIPKNIERIEAYAFSGCYSLKTVTIETNSKLTYIGNSAFVSGTKTIGRIPANVTVGDSNTFGGSSRTYGSKLTVEINANCSEMTAKNSYMYNVVGVVISDDITTLNADLLKSFLSNSETILYVDPNAHFTLTDDVTASNHKYPIFKKGEYYSDSNGVLYRIENNQAYISYCPPGLSKITVPTSVGSKKVVGVDSNAFAIADDLTEITFTTPRNINKIAEFAFSDAEKLEKINGKTNDKEILESLSTSLSYGKMPFLGTKITINVTGVTNQKLEKGSTENQNYPYMSILTENNNNANCVLSENDPNFDYTYWTGQSARTTIYLSPQGSRGYTYYVYFKFLNHQGSLNYSVGTHNIVSSLGTKYQVTIEDLDGSGLYRLAFPVLNAGDTIELVITSAVPTPTSPGGAELVWGEVCASGETPVEAGAVPNDFQWIDWRTKPKTFSINSNNYSGGSIARYTSSEPLYTVKDAHYRVQTTVSYTGINGGNLGGDYATNVEYTDRITLAHGVSWNSKINGFEWNSDIIEAIQKGDWWASASGSARTYIYARVNGQQVTVMDLATATSSSSYTGSGSYSPKVTNIRYDSSTDSIIINWNISSASYITSEYPAIYTFINPANNLIKVTDELLQNIDQSTTLTIRRNSSQVVHYSYSNDQTASSSVSTNYTVTPGALTMIKDYYNRNNTMGGSYGYSIRLYKSSGQTPVYNLRYVTDALPQRLWITPANLATMFLTDTYGEYLTVTISNATFCEPLSGNNLNTVTGSDGKEYHLSVNNTMQSESGNRYNGLVTSFTGHTDYSTGNTIVLTRDGNKVSVKVNNGTPVKCSSAAEINAVFESAGYMVTSAARYSVVWHLPDSTVVDDGDNLYFYIRSNTINTFMNLSADTRYYGTYYYNVARNYAYAYDANYGLSSAKTLASDTPDYYSYSYYEIYREASISCAVTDTRGYAVVGDQLSINTTFTNSINNYEVLPVVNHIAGTQVLLVPVSNNKNADWVSNATSYNSTYYALNKDGTYYNVYVAGYMAEKVVVKHLRDSNGNVTAMDYLIYWYMPGTHSSTTIQVPTLFSPQLSGVNSYSNYYLTADSYLNDHECHRLWDQTDPPLYTIRYLSSDKKIVTNKGTTPSGDDTATASTIHAGDVVTYRLAINTLVGDHVISLSRGDIYDILPRSTTAYQWKKGTNVINLQYVYGDGTVIDENTVLTDSQGNTLRDSNGNAYKVLTNPNSWYVADSYNGTTSSGSNTTQYISWGSDFKLNVYDKNVYIYVTVKFPEGDAWDTFYYDNFTGSYQYQYGNTYNSVRYTTAYQYSDYTSSYYYYKNRFVVAGYTSTVSHTYQENFQQLKRIVTSKGDTPAEDTLETFTYLHDSDKTLYRIAVTPNDTKYVKNLGKNEYMYDQLPRSTSNYQWSKDNVSIYYTYADGTVIDTDTILTDKDGEEVHDSEGNQIKVLENPNDWVIGDSSTATTSSAGSSTQQYIVWGSNFRLRVYDKPIYIYVTLDMPSDYDWDTYGNDQPNVSVSNYFYLNRQYSYVTHEIALRGDAMITQGVVGSGKRYGTYYSYFSKETDSRLYYVNDDYYTREVTYYISVYNSSKAKLYIDTISNVLPKGFTYSGCIDRTTDANYSYRDSSGSSRSYNYYNYNGLATVKSSSGSTAAYKRAYVSSTVTTLDDGRQKINFNVSQYYSNGSYDSILYDSSVGKCYLAQGQALVFAYTCRTNSFENSEDYAESTVAMKYYDYNGSGTRLSKGTVTGNDYFSSEKNDGKSYLYDNSTAMSLGFTGGTTNSQWLTSNVAVRRGAIEPSINKAVNQVTTAGGAGTGSTSYAAFTDKIQWVVTAYNDGKYPICDYTMTDIMQYPFRFLDSIYMNWTYPTNLGSRGNYTLLNFTSWSEDNDSVTFTYNGYSHTLDVDGEWHDIYYYNNASSTSNYDYKIRFTKDETNNNLKIDFRFTNMWWSIPEHGSARLYYSTQVPQGFPQQNKVFYNQSYITPNKQTYNEREIARGVAVRYSSIEEEQPSIRSSAQIPVSYGNVTSSYLKIQQTIDNTTYTAYSYNDDNYIIASNSNKIVTYTMNVCSADKAMQELILINNLPEVGDHETFMVEEPRNSKFQLNFAENPNVRLVIKDDGKTAVTIDPSLYTVQYSDKTEFNTDDWNGETTDGDWYDTPTENSRSIRVIIRDSSGELMKKKADVSLLFDAEIQGDPQQGQYAWDTCGYHFIAKDNNVAQEAAPTNVGIGMPSIPNLEKVLTDEADGAWTAEEDMTYKFLIYAGEAVNGLSSLDNVADIVARLESSNRDYAYCEVTVEKGETKSEELSLQLKKSAYEDGEFTETDETFEWVNNGKYTIIELPIEYSNYAFGDINDTVGNTHTFTYYNYRQRYITAKNKFKLWRLGVVKTDEEGKTLSGAAFGLYSPFEEDQLSVDEINAKIAELSQPTDGSELFDKPIPSTVDYDGETYYLKDIQESPANGTIVWGRLRMTDYIVTEIHAPEGYRRDTTLYKRSGNEFETLSVTIVNDKILGYELPETGGSELYVYIIGGLLTATTAFVLYRKLRRREEV